MTPQKTSWRTIDEIMQQAAEKVFPAAVLLIQHRGKRVFQRAYGWIDPQEQRWPVTTDTIFDLASLTKLFTATAFMTLVDAGQVTLETPVSQVLPEMGGVHPLQPGVDPHTKELLPQDPALVGKRIDADEVTFWHLLTHTSGLAAWDELCRLDESLGPPHTLPPQTRAQRINALLTNPRFVNAPGKHYLYSDLGFIMLGEAIERLAQMPLPQYLAQKVFQPLHATEIGFNPLARGIPLSRIAPTEFCQWRQRRVWGEVHDENSACLGGVAGHAGLFAPAEEVSRLGESFLAHDATLLSPALSRAMVQEQSNLDGVRRGLGWMLQTPAGGPAGPTLSPNSFGHTGFTGTSLWVDPARELVVTLLTNRVFFGRDAAGITNLRVQLHQAVTQIIDHQEKPQA